MVREVLLEGVLDRLLHVALAEGDLLELGLEGRVAAVIRPVGVKHADLGDGGVTLLFIFEIIADENEIRVCHRQIERIIEGFQLLFRHFTEVVKDLYIFRLRIVGRQGLRLDLIRRAGVDRVYAVIFDLFDIRVRKLAEHHVGGGGTDRGLFIFIEETDALLRRVRPLVKLTGQIFNGEHTVLLRRLRQGLHIDIIDRRLREDGLHRFFPGFIGNVLDIVADKDAHIIHICESQIISGLVAEFLRLDRKCFLLLNVDSSDHLSSPSS